MALQSVLAYAAGRLARVLPLQVSAGAASAGSLVALNAAGVVDATMIALPGRNLLINANFAINQRGYASGASIASGSFGHDRWKNFAGSAGSYTFTQATPPTAPNAPSSPDTTITIPSGTSVGQIVEAATIGGGTYTLSWSGTAPATVYYYTSTTATTPVASAAASPATFTLPAGAFVAVYFGQGTLATPQLELGTKPTLFDRRPPSYELELCQRYFQAFGAAAGAKLGLGLAYTGSSVVVLAGLQPMRAAPTITTTGTFNMAGGMTNSTTISVSSIAVDVATPLSLSLSCSTGTVSSGGAYFLLAAKAASALYASAEL